MSIANVSGSSGLPLELLELMTKIGNDLRREGHDTAREQAARALRKGHEEADHLREQADDIETGALIGAAFTAAGAGLQVWGATRDNIELGRNLVHVGDTSSQLGQNITGLAQASGKREEADAHFAAAEAAAAIKRADSEQSEAAEAQRVIDRARDTYSQILSLAHASKMAAIGTRA